MVIGDRVCEIQSGKHGEDEGLQELDEQFEERHQDGRGERENAGTVEADVAAVQGGTHRRR